METTTGCGSELYMAMELSASKWLLAFGNGAKVRQVSVAAGDRAGLLTQVERAKAKLGLAPEARVISCYEAGRDGFWIHRFLAGQGIANLVVDAASIEVNRRQRRAKTDRLDAERLLALLIRYAHGEHKAWRVVRVPGAEEEDERRVHREITRLKAERTAHGNRMRGLLALHGVRIRGRSLGRLEVDGLRTWEGQPLPAGVRDELAREVERLQVVEAQRAILEKAQAQRLKEPQTAGDRAAARLMQLKSVGPVSAWVLGKEFFGWRAFQNRREVAALAGLTGTPYASGSSARDQGISKAGNARVRWLMVELAWQWLRFQPESALSRWFRERFGAGTSRMRRVGIVALARKLLVALWKYHEFGLVPEGAVLKAR